MKGVVEMNKYGKTFESPFFLYASSTLSMLGDELDIVKSMWGDDRVSDCITDIPEGSVVVPRMRFIPFGLELQKDIEALGSITVNTYQEHRNIANLYNWIHLLDGLTAEAYRLEDLPNLPEGEYFVKGETNSIKNQWHGKAYARDKKELIETVGNVLNDQYVGAQEIVIRPFQKFRQIGEALNGRPIFHERRIFILNGIILSEGFYWSNFSDELGEVEILDETLYWKALNEAISRTEHLAPFYVIDLAEYPEGSWKVVELNDGVQSGLSDNDPHLLWRNFQNGLTTF